MKEKRQARLLQLVAEGGLGTQDDITEALRRSGFPVAQATVSRDIRELGLVKMRDKSGKVRFVLKESKDGIALSHKFATIFSESIVSVKNAQNLVVVKCLTGMANAACAALDTVEFSEVIGTIAGDDTFLLILPDNESAEAMAERIGRLATGK